MSSSFVSIRKFLSGPSQNFEEADSISVDNDRRSPNEGGLGVLEQRKNTSTDQ